MKYIDNVDFAKKGQTLSRNINAAELIRARELFEELDGILDYTITGGIDKKNKPILTVRIYGKIITLCQNCLEKMTIDVDYSNVMPIFYTESDLDNALFGEEASYTDGILKDAHFSIDDFIEDELIMLLPIAPKHKKCDNIKHHETPDNPFSVLVNKIDKDKINGRSTK